MKNFKEMLTDVLDEKQKTFKDLETAKIIGRKSYQKYDYFTPFLPTVINIANFLEVSIDYLVGKSLENNFKKYKKEQINFCANLEKLLTYAGITKAEFSDKLGFDDSIFTKWRHGQSPRFSTILLITEYLGCSIDDLLDFE